jgi:hypothetical protein
MVQRKSCPCLLLESRQRLLVARQSLGRKLQRNAPAKVQVPRRSKRSPMPPDPSRSKHWIMGDLRNGLPPLKWTISVLELFFQIMQQIHRLDRREIV